MVGRRWIRAAALAVAVAVLGAGALPTVPAIATVPAAGAAPTRPNLVVIQLDDLDEVVMPYWDALPRTRALLRDRGRVFDNFFSTSPVSGPARTAVLSGKYGHNNGVLTNHGDWGGYPAWVAKGNGPKHFGKYLQDAGYRTMQAGKYVVLYEPGQDGVPPGWTEWYGAGGFEIYEGYGYLMNENGVVKRYTDAPGDYLTDVIRRKAEGFIDRSEATDSKPFMMFLNPTAPHVPLPPAPRHADHAWKSASVPQRPNFYEPDISDKPGWLTLSLPNRDAWRDTLDADYQDRMGSLLAVDEMVYGVMTKLAQRGELANTYIVFTSDHGYNLGAHHLYGKNVPYEEASHTPLVIWGPGVVAGQERHLAIQPDLLPTLLDLAGVPIPSDIDGRSLTPLLAAQDPPDWRDAFLLQYKTDIMEWDTKDPRTVAIYWNFPNYRAVRSDRYLLVEWWEDWEWNGVHDYELYDLATDPYQLENLVATDAGKAQHFWVGISLLVKLRNLGECSGASCNVAPSAPYAGSNPVPIPRGGV